MGNQIAECPFKGCTSLTCRMTTSILFQDWQFLCGRENCVHQRCVLLTTGLQQIYLRARLSSLCEGRMSLAVLSFKVGDWNEKVCQFFHKRLMRWWLGNVVDCLKVGLHNNQAASRGNCILGTIIMHLPDMAMWQLRNSNHPPDVLHRGMRLETRPKENMFSRQVFSFSLTLVFMQNLNCVAKPCSRPSLPPFSI